MNSIGQGDTVINILRDIIVQEMNLDSTRVNIYNQRIDPNLLKDEGIFIFLERGPSSIISSRNYTRNGTNGLEEVQELNTRDETIVGVFSKNLESIERKEEVVMAIHSIYSQQQQEENSFKIFSHSPIIELSMLEGAAQLYRFDIRVTTHSWYQKIKTADYYDKFKARVVDNAEYPFLSTSSSSSSSNSSSSSSSSSGVVASSSSCSSSYSSSSSSSAVSADIYPVGPGKTYTNIADAVAAVMAFNGSNPFTKTQVIEIYTDIYDNTNVIEITDGTLSPTSAYHLVIKAASGNTPVINGGGSKDIVQIRNISYVDIDGIEGYNTQWYGIALNYGGPSAIRQTSHVTIRNCVLHDVLYRFPIFLNGLNAVGTENECNNCLIENNTCYNATAAGAAGIEVWGTCNDNIIQYNTIYDCDRGIDISVQNAGYLFGSGNESRYNTIHDVAIGIAHVNITGTTNANPIIDGNIIYDTTNQGISSSCGLEITNNIIYGCTSLGAIFVDYSVSNLKIYNNTIVGNSTGIWYRNNGVTIYNNILRNNTNGDYYTDNGNSPTIDYNDNSLSDVAFAAWQAAGHDTHGINIDPLFASGTNNYHLTSSSPCIGIGTNLYSEGVTKDADRVARPSSGPFDLGAYQV